MENNRDIRWLQRFDNFKKALSKLNKFCSVGILNELEEQGLIKSFEYTYELAWKTLQDLFQEKGFENIVGPKPVIDHAFQSGYIKDGKAWVQMHKSRNLTSHTYDSQTAQEIAIEIRNTYVFLLNDLVKTLLEEPDHLRNTLFDKFE